MYLSLRKVENILRKKKTSDDAARGNVRLAVEADLPLIEKWLPKERDSDTLASSWQITKEAFRGGNLYVWVSVESDLPLGYCWGTLNSHSSVLEVHPGYRGRGIDREMVAFILMASVKNRNPLLEILCAPETSAVFWESMGFTTYTIGYKVYGRRVLDMPQELPGGDPISVKISLFPTYFSNLPGDEPLAVHNLFTVEIPRTKRLMLSHVVAHYYLSDCEWLRVELVLNGERIYDDLAKCDRAEGLGIHACQHGVAISEITLPYVWGDREFFQAKIDMTYR